MRFKFGRTTTGGTNENLTTEDSQEGQIGFVSFNEFKWRSRAISTRDQIVEA
jgi:hypothetical protein